jgi:hypothetical protein
MRKKTFFGWIKHKTRFDWWDGFYDLTYFQEGYHRDRIEGSKECKNLDLTLSRVVYESSSFYLNLPRPRIHRLKLIISSRGIDTNYIFVDHRE